MEHTAEIPLTTVQKSVILALAAGYTITDAAETNGIQRITIYRWMKTRPEFTAALHRARAEFVLARRDDLHHLSNRALETLLHLLDDPRSSPAVLLRAAMFILQRPQVPKTGWSMPEPSPNPDGKKLVDSAIIEQDYDQLPGLQSIARYPDADADDEADADADPDAPTPMPPADSPAPPPSEAAPNAANPADATPPANQFPEQFPEQCTEMLHDSPVSDDVAPAACDPSDASSPSHRQTGLRSCPVPPEVLKARHNHERYLNTVDLLRSVHLAAAQLDNPIPPDDDENAGETDEIPTQAAA